MMLDFDKMVKQINRLKRRNSKRNLPEACVDGTWFVRGTYTPDEVRKYNQIQEMRRRFDERRT